MIFIGDVHSLFPQYLALRAKYEQTFTLGDIGFGFPDTMDVISLIPPDNRHRFIRGNHDNPEVFHKHPNALPDWGYHKGMDLFWVSGAMSIDQRLRVPGMSWWSTEQLSMLQMEEALKEYKLIKPKYVVSHECPSRVQVKSFLYSSNMTQDFLDTLMKFHKPSMWLYGHYHYKVVIKINKVVFVCCGMIQAKSFEDKQRNDIHEVPGLYW